MKRKSVKKAVIAAAGFGTRFLPQTKAMPKEMLPLIDKPIIQYVVEELVDAGITDIIIVTNYHKRAIEDHFDSPNAELTTLLEDAGKLNYLDDLIKISQLANIAYVRQKEHLGNIGPVYYAADWLGEEPFIYTYSDDFIAAQPSRFKQMIAVYEKHGTSVASCIKVTNDSDYDKYGIVAGEEVEASLLDVSTIVEKPGKAKAPSNMASVSGFLLTPDIFPFIRGEVVDRNRGINTQIQTAIQSMIEDGGKLYALMVKNGKFHDAGNKLEYLKTVVEFALQREDVGEQFKTYLRNLSLK